jgi:hypothetical protein
MISKKKNQCNLKAKNHTDLFWGIRLFRINLWNALWMEFAGGLIKMSWWDNKE